MKKSWQNTVFLYIYQVVGVYGWELSSNTTITVTVSDIKSQVSHQNRSQLTLKEPWGAYFKKIVF